MATENKNAVYDSNWNYLGSADIVYWNNPIPETTQLKNADMNINKYWDDSSSTNYNNPELWGWKQDKYTWANTNNSFTAYNKDATIENLDPNYKYGEEAKIANSNEANYIANRNDQIASALYNAWKTSIEDVSNFLITQQGFGNSTENERQNTIYSIWKRLGQIQKDNEKKEEQTKIDANNQQALNNMQNDLLQDTSWKVYGKVWVDNNWITTLSDPYNVDKMMAESRMSNLKSLQSMDSQSIAASIISWTTPYWEQAMRDLMQYNPQKYEEVQTAIKQLKWQQTINSITNWEWDVVTVENTTNGDMAEFAESNSNSMNSVSQILKSVQSTLESNNTAMSAQELMWTIENDMMRLQDRMKNLKKEASQVFKWDVPQYIVNAYVANRTAEIQDELQILENRYNAAYDRYKTELSYAQWQEEMSIKRDELQIKKESSTLDNYLTSLNIKIKQKELWSNYTQEEIQSIFDEFVSTYTEWMDLWAIQWQCWAFVKKYLSSIWINLPNISSIDSKKALIDESITEPTEWDIVIMSSPTHPENWHIAIVSSIDDDWTIHLLEANRNDDHKVHTTRTVKPWDKNILWYYRPQAVTAWKKQDSFTRKDGTVFDLSDTPTYDTLSYDQQNIVQQLINLNKNPSTITKRQYWDDFEKIMSAVKEINPSWSDADFGQADKVKKERNTSSKNGSNSRNATATATAKEIYDFADEYWNMQWKDYNAMVNWFRNRASDPKYSRLAVKVQTLASEFAWALKWWNAAPTEQEIQDAKSIISTSLSSGWMKAVAEEMARQLYNKNVTEADNYRNVTLEKPNSIRIWDIAEWLEDVVWVDISSYYNYGTQLSDIPPEDTSRIDKYFN